MSFQHDKNFLYKDNAIFIFRFPIPRKMAFIWKGSPQLFQQPSTLSPSLRPSYGGIDTITSVINLRETAIFTADDFKLPSNDLIRKTYILDDDFMEGYESCVGVSLVIEHWALNMSTVVYTETIVGCYVQCQGPRLNTMMMSCNGNTFNILLSICEGNPLVDSPPMCQ